MTVSDQALWEKACKLMATLPLHLDDTPGLSVSEIHGRTLAACRGEKPRLVVIDYLGLLRSGERAETRNLEVGAMTRALKGMAKMLGCPVLLLSQLNREPDKRSKGRPQLSDLRDSGAIEQDADVVLFLYRKEEATGETEIIVAKNRHGPTGTATVQWQAAITLFRDLATKDNPYG